MPPHSEAAYDSPTSTVGVYKYTIAALAALAAEALLNIQLYLASSRRDFLQPEDRTRRDTALAAAQELDMIGRSMANLSPVPRDCLRINQKLGNLGAACQQAALYFFETIAKNSSTDLDRATQYTNQAIYLVGELIDEMQ